MSPRLPLLFALVSVLAAADPLAGLLPAGLKPGGTMMVNDGQGGAFQIDSQGALDAQGVNNLGLMTLNQNWQFNVSGPPQGTPDGAEVVLTAQANGLTVVRRIRSCPKLGVIRYIDILANPGGAPVNVSMVLGGWVHFQPQALGESGQALAGQLGPKDGAIILKVPPNYGSNGFKDLVIGLCDPRSKVKPTVMAMQNQMAVTWQLAIPAGKAVAVLTTMTARTLGQVDAKSIQAVLAPGRKAALLADLSPALRKILVNWRGGASAGSDDAPALAGSIPEDLVAARGDDADLLALGAGTRLRGEATGGDLSIALDGKVQRVPWAEVLALSGGSPGCLFLRDGEVLTGVPAEAECVFTLATGQAVKLPVARIGWLLRRPDGKEGLPQGEVLLQLNDRQRLVGKPAGSTVRCATLWGPLELRLADIASLAPAEGGGSQVALRDGSRFHAFLTSGAIELETRFTGRRRIELTAIAGISGGTAPRAAGAAEPEPVEATAPWALLAGGQTMMGTIDLSEVHLRLAGNRLPVPPPQIRKLVNLAGEDADDGWKPLLPRLRLELWTGDVMEGTMEETMVPLRTVGGLLRIPPGDLVEVHVPTAVIAPATRARIAELVAQLGDRDWQRRESSAKALIQLGEVVRQPVEEALRAATDPEVKARLEQVQAGLK